MGRYGREASMSYWRETGYGKLVRRRVGFIPLSR